MKIRKTRIPRLKEIIKRIARALNRAGYLEAKDRDENFIKH